MMTVVVVLPWALLIWVRKSLASFAITQTAETVTGKPAPRPIRVAEKAIVAMQRMTRILLECAPSTKRQNGKNAGVGCVESNHRAPAAQGLLSGVKPCFRGYARPRTASTPFRVPQDQAVQVCLHALPLRCARHRRPVSW